MLCTCAQRTRDGKRRVEPKVKTSRARPSFSRSSTSPPLFPLHHQHLAMYSTFLYPPSLLSSKLVPPEPKNTVILPGTPSGKPQRHVPLRENDPRPPFTQLFEHEPRPAPSSPSSFLDKLASFTRRRSSTSKPSQQGLFSPLPPCLRPNLLSLPSTATAAPSSFLLTLTNSSIYEWTRMGCYTCEFEDPSLDFCEEERKTREGGKRAKLTPPPLLPRLPSSASSRSTIKSSSQERSLGLGALVSS